MKGRLPQFQVAPDLLGIEQSILWQTLSVPLNIAF
jgi:hypothetical protein